MEVEPNGNAIVKNAFRVFPKISSQSRRELNLFFDLRYTLDLKSFSSGIQIFKQCSGRTMTSPFLQPYQLIFVKIFASRAGDVGAETRVTLIQQYGCMMSLFRNEIEERDRNNPRIK